MKKTIKGEYLLLLTAMIWGMGFISQKLGMEYNGPLTFSGVRLLVGSLVLIPVFIYIDKKKGVKGKFSKNTLLGGLISGIFLSLGTIFQQIGLISTSAGKSAFLTTLYILIVPFIAIFIKKRISKFSVIGAIIGTFGLYLLSIKEGFYLETGDIWLIVGAVFWSFQIIFIDIFVNKSDPIRLAFLQFLVAGIICSILMFVFEEPSIINIYKGYLSILYAGVFSIGIAFTLQVIAQRNTEPTIAGIIMSMESVFALIFGIIFLKEVITLREFIGSAVMLIAILVSQIKQKDYGN